MQIGHEHWPASDDESANQIPETLACAEIAWRGTAEFLWHEHVARWLFEACEPPLAAVLRRVWSEPDPTDAIPVPIDPTGFFEDYLRCHDRRRRKERGVYFTPRVLAKYVVRQVHACLQSEFGLTDGLADTATWRDVSSTPETAFAHLPFVQILDPAAGSGIFLIETIDCIHDTLQARWRMQSIDAGQALERWSAYVTSHLLPRLSGIELLPAAGLIAQINIARKLAETGFDFKTTGRFRFRIANTLAVRNSLEVDPVSVILGNPPFRGISSNATDGMSDLLRGRAPDGTPVASYYEVNGRPLGERKVWLQDDYVKFLRHAHWLIEQSQCGVIGFVTNHGYLDNTTFRGLRQALCTTFPRIDILDLRGNSKKGEASDSQPDEAVFDVQQGVAVGLFRRPPSDCSCSVQHAELRGTRSEKLEQLATSSTRKSELTPRAPHYAFVPELGSMHPEYECGVPLNALMPTNSTAVVTARDRFVVALDEQELLARLHAFCDPTISDTEIRRRFFTRGRSTKYQAGDTRGWKLSLARKRMQAERNPGDYIRSCLYRPFDRRLFFWADWMIDWPRPEVMNHLCDPGNVALIARRQMPAVGPCEFFWVTDAITLDGVIRSDNRGSESVFPLYLRDNSCFVQVNICPAFIGQMEATLQRRWCPLGVAGTSGQFSGRDVLHYVYALFNSPTYKRRYASELRRDFPRVLFPQGSDLWDRLCNLGSRLVALHLARFAENSSTVSDRDSHFLRAAGFPDYRDGQILPSSDSASLAASQRVWDFRVGTYQVCRKWLRDRRELSPLDLACYQQMLAALQKTLEIRDEIDSVVAASGGWPAAFLMQSANST